MEYAFLSIFSVLISVYASFPSLNARECTRHIKSSSQYQPVESRVYKCTVLFALPPYRCVNFIYNCYFPIRSYARMELIQWDFTR